MDSDGLHRLIYEVTKYMLVFALILNRSFWKGGWTAWVGGLLVQVLQKSPLLTCCITSGQKIL